MFLLHSEEGYIPSNYVTERKSGNLAQFESVYVTFDTSLLVPLLWQTWNVHVVFVQLVQQARQQEQGRGAS